MSQRNKNQAKRLTGHLPVDELKFCQPLGRLHPHLIHSGLGKLGPILGLGQEMGLLLQDGLGVSFFLLHLLQLELDPVELLSLLLKGNMMRVVGLSLDLFC